MAHISHRMHTIHLNRVWLTEKGASQKQNLIVDDCQSLQKYGKNAEKCNTLWKPHFQFINVFSCTDKCTWMTHRNKLMYLALKHSSEMTLKTSKTLKKCSQFEWCKNTNNQNKTHGYSNSPSCSQPPFSARWRNQPNFCNNSASSLTR